MWQSCGGPTLPRSLPERRAGILAEEGKLTRAPEESKAGGHPDTPDKSGETARRGILMLATGVARFALAEHFHATVSTLAQSHRSPPLWLISRQRSGGSGSGLFLSVSAFRSRSYFISG